MQLFNCYIGHTSVHSIITSTWVLGGSGLGLGHTHQASGMAMSTSTEAEVESADQFAGSDLVLEQADCRVFVGDRELGTGILTITERL